ncbi:MAG: hypothetical protein RL685_1703 [Pseudomonadota bacterium]|jgi:hypothetical protein
MTDTPNPGPNDNDPAAAGAEGASKPARVREAISLIKEHPLGAVATVAAATALLELEFAVGLLAGLGATALLVNKSGPERRRIVMERGKWALERARAMKESAMKKKTVATEQPAPPASPV